MATIRAFSALRPRPDMAHMVAALPYDVLNVEEATKAAEDNPYSFLRVDKAEINLEGVDPYDERVYEAARDNLRWLIKNAMVWDEKPCLFIYRLEMDGRSQAGLVACTSIDEYLSGIIKKHENTRVDKENDRIRHVEMTNANTGPIFLAYRLEECPDIRDIMALWMYLHNELFEFTTDDGIVHTVWKIDDPDVLMALFIGFTNVSSLYIADGHHRQAAAVNVGLKRRKMYNEEDISEAEYNYTLSVIFPDNELLIMDYNRFVSDLNGLTKEEFLESVGKIFEVKPVKYVPKPQTARTFGMYMTDQWYELKYSGEVEETDPVASLDVSILQDKLLAPIMGINDPRTDKRIDFIGGKRGLLELERRVNAEILGVAFAMFPTSMEQLMRIADAGLIMPPKSTWFEPKLLSGLFIHKFS
ncbi:MAG: DUF1015 family protein [Clostridiales bacterium]|jgi:uncharacterized protein (DUF1015 family)|nr:DUF1015 family protein [Clostridiales bacterium]